MPIDEEKRDSAFDNGKHGDSRRPVLRLQKRNDAQIVVDEIVVREGKRIGKDFELRVLKNFPPGEETIGSFLVSSIVHPISSFSFQGVSDGF